MPEINTEIISIGNELLIGDVLDTNSQWLCQRITGLGGRVRRITTIMDDPAAIGDTLKAAMGRGARVIFTSGGLGPTVDDLTVASIAEALGRRTREHEAALEYVRSTYARLAQAGYVPHAVVTSERRKMAMLPDGAEALYNPAGPAPGVVVREGQTTIISLPGVPAELRGIFEESMPALLRELYGRAFYAERVARVNTADESVMAPAVRAVAAGFRDVYVKSRAKTIGPDSLLTVTLSARGETREQVEETLAAALEELRRRLSDAGVEIIEVK